ncbi:MAG: heme-binding protein [Oceanospirillales bacterium]|nr:heme-binding protein [Oceanospirillales bacterium]
MLAKTARLTALGLTLCAANAFAAPALVEQRPDVSLTLANQLIEATLDACHQDDRTAVVAVVDRGGNLVALQRDDNVGPHNTLAAQRKAFTSLSTKNTSRALSDLARNTPDAENLNTLDELLLLGGGVPLKVEGHVIGAIGVAGAGGAAIDEGCALTAIDKVLPKTL